MVYIPKNRCVLNLIATNDEWVYKLDTETFYNGPYWKMYTGQAFTGEGPNDKLESQKEIILAGGADTDRPPPNPIAEMNYIPLHIGDPDPMIDRDTWNGGELRFYLKLTGQDPQNEQVRDIPFTHYPQPTEKDYKLGIFERYFAVRVNSNHWVETNKTSYDKIDSNDVANWVSELYRVVKFMWTIVGPEKEVKKINKDMVALYEKKAGYVRGRPINFPKRGLKEYLKSDFSKFRIGDNPDEVNSAFYVKKLNNLNYNQLVKVVEKAEYIISGENKEWLNNTQEKANQNNRSLYEQALFEANWVLYQEPKEPISEEEPKSKTIWRVARELKLKEERKEKVISQANYILSDENSKWYKLTEDKANEKGRPLYEQAMREANWVLYTGNPEHKAKVKQKKEINEIVKELKLINPAKDWIKEKALYIKSGENEKWLRKTKKKRRKWNKENEEDKRSLLYQCFKEAKWVWDNKESKNRKYN
tara:strand:- start:1090 stop:2514 length:1425 start_codon:yes stop_codon:yes gene_type:complete